MTDLWTASYRSWTPRAGQPVVISLQTPRWLPEAAAWPVLWPACPRWSYFRASAQRFEDAYLRQLQRYGIKRIAQRLAEITRQTGADRLCLLCWEWGGPDGGRSRCHRGTWADWWLVTTGEIVPELDPANKSGQAAR